MNKKTKELNDITKMMLGHSVEELVDMHTKGMTDHEIIKKCQDKVKEEKLIQDVKNLFKKET